MKRLNFFDCLEDNSKYAGKISKSNCLESGEIAVVSQSKKLIDGYTNISKKSFKICQYPIWGSYRLHKI